jgi:trimethylamine--corrinoid protein Co-methyltransferase
LKPSLLRLLDQEQVGRILDEALEVLKSPGVMIENDEAAELLMDVGATGDKETRFFSIPSHLVEKCLGTAPKHFEVYDLEGRVNIRMAGDHVAFRPGATALNIIDPETDEYRPPVTRDLVRWVKMVEGIPALEAQSGSMNCADVPSQVADSHRYYIMLKLSNKTVCGGAYTVEGWHTIKEMLIAAAGSEDALKRRPISIQPACPTPPLKWTHDPCQTIINNAKLGIPVIIDPMMMTGAGAPVTLEGSLVQHTAEAFAALVVHQLASPGAPFIWGGSPTVMDLREGTACFGAIETAMLGCGHVQIGKQLGLPTGTALGITDSKTVDAQAGLEAATSMFVAMLSGANFIMGAGMIDFESGQSFEKLIIDAEIIQMLRHLLRGIVKTERPIATGLFRDPEYAGDFMSLQHTLRWMRKELHYPSAVIDRKNASNWAREGKSDIVGRARRRANELIEGYEPKRISAELSAELDAIMTNASALHGMERLPDIL